MLFPRTITAFTIFLAAASARADHPALQIARSTDSPPRIVLRGPAALLNGFQTIDLPPGDAGFAGRWIHDEPSFQTLGPDRRINGLAPLAPRHRIALRRLSLSDGLLLCQPSTMRPILQRDGDNFEFIHDPAGQFGINLLTVADRPGTLTATLQLIDLSGQLGPSRPFTLRFKTTNATASAPAGPPRYICPMRCENEKTYPAPGVCPECKMRLADINAHQDHRPHHGGQFFMAPDQIHHLEGVRVGADEFRIYFYDEYTQPLPADGFKIRAMLRDGDPPPHFRCNESHDYQYATLKRAAGATLKTWIDFHDGAAEQPFEFGPFSAPASQP